MKCPKCGKGLSLKKIHTTKTGSIEADYCKSCGGIFFDKGEVNRVSHETAHDLAEQAPGHVDTSEPGTGECPKCGADLKQYFGESVPNDVHVLRCPECSGTWFDAEELDHFKEAQDAKINYFKTWKMPMSSLSAVLIPIALLVVMTGSTVLTVNRLEEVNYQRTRASEILSTPSVIPGPERNSATIIFATSEPARTEIEFTYARPLGTVTLPLDEGFGNNHQINITDLEPGQRYTYKINVVTYEDSFTSDMYEFEL